MTKMQTLMKTDRPYLTDGGMETWLFFQQGYEAPEFAAITLVEDKGASAALRQYYDEFLAMAEKARTGFVLDTNTWRGCTQWAPKLGMSEEELLRLSGEAVKVAKNIRDDWAHRVPEILLNGVIGPAGDAYSPETLPTPQQAEAMHAPQMRVFAGEGVDMVSALTLTNVAEAIGITKAAQAEGLPVVISFTVETDGRLPSGELLSEAVAAVDAATNLGPAYYMINCAHPDHFQGRLDNGGDWTDRIGGVRANASRLSHAELDEAEELDQGDADEFGRLHQQLARSLRNLRVVGGCCGTDHRHVGCVSRQLHDLELS